MVLATIMTVLASPVAYCNWTNNDPAAVVQECTAQLLAQTPEPWMYFNRGLAFKMLGQLEEAYLDYSKAIALNPTFAAAFTNRGNVGLSAMTRPEQLRIGPPSHLTQAMR